MKNFVLIFILLSLFSSKAFTQDVSFKEARNIAINAFEYKQKIHSINTGKNTISDWHIEKQTNGTPLLYIFNFKEKGYICIAGNKNISPIVLYDFESTYNPENTDQREVIEQLTNAIQNLKDVDNKKTTKAKWDEYAYPKSIQKSSHQSTPILGTLNWSQRAPYNLSCPPDNTSPDGHTVVGCVAIAGGKILYHYSYPENPQGVVSNTYNGITRTEDLAYTHFDYDLMYEDNTYEIGNMLQKIGFASDMEYGVDGSGTHILDLYDALINNFYYSPNAIYVNSFTSFETIRAEINNHRPVIVAGNNIDATSAHAYVIDGYDYEDDNIFHISEGTRSIWTDLSLYTWSYVLRGIILLEPGKDLECFSSGELPLTINQYDHGSYSQAASNSIIATNTVDNGEVVSISAGTSITLKTGFKVESGGLFVGKIAPCGDNAYPLKSETMATEITEEVKNSIYIYPTISDDGIFSIQNIEDKANIKVTDNTGKTVLNTSTNISSDIINLSAFEKGIYYISIESKDVIHTEKVIIN